MDAAPGTTQRTQRRRILIVLCLNAALIVGLVVAGFAANSVSVLAAAGDTVADCFGLIVGLIAIGMRDRDPEDPRAQRPIAVAALVNATLLLVVVVTIVLEAVSRLLAGSPPVEGLPIVIVSVITMLVMLAGAVVLGRSAASEDLHMRSVLLDSLADAAAAAAIAVAGVVILLTGGLYWLDPVLALVVSVVVAVAALRLLVKAIASLRGEDVDFDDD
ncbi:cation diffusion facilitator family transporter [Microbacterium rhizosphaerae]|uniref:Cation diffusion facilitator family transporter n=1 Tax=Microbacterium rhizosphaerae TaxID=1678237 RepID=A0ABZ0SQ28_9MICO|nr:cation diffusion facilitator family transporter [Microbacterium rhizosphaerae]WPR90411.1 cation diffusion facilitator family transporter [Microbacterium rhizosphaerae]